MLGLDPGAQKPRAYAHVHSRYNIDDLFLSRFRFCFRFRIRFHFRFRTFPLNPLTHNEGLDAHKVIIKCQGHMQGSSETSLNIPCLL